MKISIHGSRGLEDERVKIILLEELQRRDVSCIVTHAEPAGVCKVARQIAREKAIPLKLHFLNFKYLRGAFERRSKAVLADCDLAICIHDGTSKGTANEIKLAKKMQVETVTHLIEESEHKQSVGFDIDEDWDVDTKKPAGAPVLELKPYKLEDLQNG